MPTALSTQSDCELPLHLYRRHGLDFTAHLRGMYAIALHDPAAGQLVLARDPFGIKPLYYAETASAFAFASEPRRVDRGRPGRAAARPRGAQRAACRCSSRPAARRSSPGLTGSCPGETVVVAGRAASSSAAAASALPAGRAAAARRDTRRLPGWMRRLRKASACISASDVPFGMFLSGGIDSTAVLMMMARLPSARSRRSRSALPGSEVADERAGGARRRGFGRGRACRARRSMRRFLEAAAGSRLRRSTTRPPIMRSCRPEPGAAGAPQPGSKSFCRARAATSFSPAMAAIAARCGRGGRADACRGRAACSTGSACCAAISPAGATASPPPRRSRKRRPANAAAGRAGGRLSPTGCRTIC